ncbi:MAG: hypothetical protein Q9170_006400 [Blastenia crenularia]
MFFHKFILCFVLLIIGLAFDVSSPLTCRPTDQLPATVLSARASPIPHGSMGSAGAVTTRCPRVKPTVTLTETITSEGPPVPTSSGFTPIPSETPTPSSQLYSLQTHETAEAMIVSLNDLRQATTLGNELLQSMSCGPEKSSSSYTLTIPSNCPAMSTVTTTATITVASPAVYDACIADYRISHGLDKGAGQGIRALTFQNVTSTSTIDVATAYDCCVACQLLDCAYGDFIVNPPYPGCDLYFQDHCDPSAPLGSAFYSNVESAGPLSPDQGFTVFNGPCGQIVYGGSSI